MSTTRIPAASTPTALDPEHLPDDPAALKALIVELLATLQGSQRELEQVRQRLDQLLRRLYGPRAERFVPGQGFLFADLEPEVAPPAEAARAPEEVSPRPATPARRGHGRQRLPENLPRVTCVHDLTAAERSCPCCGQERLCIGQQTSEQLDYQPASLFVVQHVRKTYVCQRCLVQPEATPRHVDPQTLTLVDTQVSPDNLFATASLPPQVVPRGLAGPGLLAHLIVSKFVDHVPLYRL